MDLFIKYLIFCCHLGEVIQEALILKHILNGYNADVRPELAHAEPLPVTFEMKLQKIVKLVR